MKFFKIADYIGYAIAKLTNVFKSACLLRVVFTQDSLKTKKYLEIVFMPYVLRNFLICFSFVILHILAKFQYQNVLTSQVIQ